MNTRINADNEDPDTVEAVEGPAQERLFQIKNIQLYNIESVKPAIKNRKSEFERTFYR